jgi:hypothetical protein
LYLVGGIWALIICQKEMRTVNYMEVGFELLAIVGLTLAWYRYTKTAPTPTLPLGFQEQLHNLEILRTPQFWTLHFVSRFPEICATYSGCILGALGAWQLWKRTPRDEALFWIGWFMITFVYTELLGEYGFHHGYTDLPWAPINAVFIALGIVWIWDRGLRSVAIILVLGIPLHAALRIAHWYSIDQAYLFRAKPVLNSFAKPDDLIYTNSREIPVLLYYLDHYGYSGEWRYLSSHPEWAAELRRRGAKCVVSDLDYVIYQLH